MPDEPTDQQLAEWLDLLKTRTLVSIDHRFNDVFRCLPATIQALQAARERIAELERYISGLKGVTSATRSKGDES